MSLLIGIQSDTAVNYETAKTYLETFARTLRDEQTEFATDASPIPLDLMQEQELPADKRAVIEHTNRLFGFITSMLSKSDILAEMNDVKPDMLKLIERQNDDIEMVAAALETFDKSYVATPLRGAKEDRDHLMVMDDFVRSITTFPFNNPRFFMDVIYYVDPKVDPKEVVSLASAAQSQFFELFESTIEQTTSKTALSLHQSLKREVKAGSKQNGARLH